MQECAERQSVQWFAPSALDYMTRDDGSFHSEALHYYEVFQNVNFYRPLSHTSVRSEQTIEHSTFQHTSAFRWHETNNYFHVIRHSSGEMTVYTVYIVRAICSKRITELYKLGVSSMCSLSLPQSDVSGIAVIAWISCCILMLAPLQYKHI